MFFLRLLSRLPFSVLYLISDFLFFGGYYVAKYRRNIVWNNLKNSFPEKSHEELRIIECDYFKNLCDYGVETLKLITITKEELSERMHYLNPEVLQPYRNQNQSVILLASHQFNWEWLLTSGSINLPFSVDFIYQKQSSEFFNKFSLAGRSRFGAYGIERNQTAREAIKRKDVVRSIAIVADQFPRFEKKYWTNFLTQETAFFLGIGQFAVITQYPVFFGSLKKIKRGYYEATLIPVSVPPYEKGSEIVVDSYAKITEKLIRESPDNWLWSHDRWKEKRK